MIRLWYGDEQHFGFSGLPQRWINVLGCVETAGTLPTLQAVLNRGKPFPVALGPDGRRLVGRGDFNVEIDSTHLRSGANRLVLEARWPDGKLERGTVKIRMSAWRTWPIPWTWDGGAGDETSPPQIVDGLWTDTEDGLRTSRPGYDRVLAFGDRLWRDYEVTARLTIHGFDRSVIGDPIQAGPAVMLVLRWEGHTEREGFRPRTGWYPYGATICYGWYPDQARFGLSIQGNDPNPAPADRMLALDATDTALREGVAYDIRAYTRTRPGTGSTYGVKVWPAGQAEPAAWALTAEGLPSGLPAGSCLFVAHNADVTLNSLSVMP